MTWVKLSDTALEDPGLLPLSRGAILMAIEAVAYSNRHGLGGAIPAAALRRLTTEPDPDAAAAELVAAGQWDQSGDGWQLVWLLEDQPTAEQVDRTRSRWKRAQQALRDRRELHLDGDHSTCDPKRCRVLVAAAKRGASSGDSSVSSSDESSAASSDDSTNPPTPTPTRSDSDPTRKRGRVGVGSASAQHRAPEGAPLRQAPEDTLPRLAPDDMPLERALKSVITVPPTHHHPTTHEAWSAFALQHIEEVPPKYRDRVRRWWKLETIEGRYLSSIEGRA